MPSLRWISLLLACSAGVLLAAAAQAADAPRYEASFVDGRRVEGNAVSAWQDDNSQAKLEAAELLNPGQPLRWFKDRRPVTVVRPEFGTGFVEMVGGDRIPGTVVGLDAGEVTYQAGNLVEPQLLVRPDVALAAPNDNAYEHVRVLVRFVRRVVWSDSPRADLQPGTLFLRDGRSTTFRSVRWNRDDVRVLTGEGLKTFAYRDLAELHLPEVDFWDSYKQELAVLDPDNTARIVRIQTTAGLIMTGSTKRAKVMNNGGAPDNWFHMLQPAWSLDPLWVPFTTIQARQYFAPNEVPLSRLIPSDVVQKSLLGGGWRWQLDSNAQRGPLVSGGLQHGWGIGVHALSELSFKLPAIARSFRTKIGIDQASGDGGCVRARVFVTAAGQTARQQLFQSDHLIGSTRGVDTGELALPVGTTPLVLTLQADPDHDERPAGADPLDIRDAVDWLEPLVTLDLEKLRAEVAAVRSSWIPAWDGWTLEPSSGSTLVLANEWQQLPPLRGSYQVTMRPGSAGATLSRELQLNSEDRWLLLAVRRLNGAPAGNIFVRINGEPAGEFEIPFFGNEIPKPLTVPIGKYAGRKVKVELEQREAEKPEFVAWTAISVAGQLPTSLKLFEDDARGLNPNPLPAGVAQLVDDDPYTGSRCIRLSPADGMGISFNGLNIRIRERPLIGEFRYMRFAIRMVGNVRMGMECIPTVAEQQVRKYDAGVGPPAIEGAARMIPSAPTEWVLKTQDLFVNWGAYDLQEIKFLAVGEGQVLIDHIYLARSEADFNDIGAQDPISLQQQTEQAQLAVFQQAVTKANAATVLIDVEGLYGSGVLITKDGFIATTGFAAVAPGKEAKITLADGRTVPAITLGINRDADAAMLKITAEGEYPFLEIGNSQGLPVDGRLATVAFVGDLKQKPKKGASLVRYRMAEGGGLWVSLMFDRSFSGGPIVDREGKLIGLVSRPFGPGGTLAMPMHDFNASRERLSRSEVWGAWPLAVTPNLGMNVGSREDKLKVIGVAAGGPSARAGVQLDDELITFDGQPVKSFQELLKLLAQKLPGQKVSLQLTRAGVAQTAEISLERR